VDSVLVEIAAQIVSAQRSPSEWAEVESDDMFQRTAYIGGYDADERAFVFSASGPAGELWFQFTLDEAQQISAGEAKTLPARLSEA
jgi:hypothetical protein